MLLGGKLFHSRLNDTEGFRVAMPQADCEAIYLSALLCINFFGVDAGTFFAHLHKDDFHVLSYDASNDAARVATILFSSISPVYENNPAYRLMYFNPDGWFLADYTQYWTDLVLDNSEYTCMCVRGGGGGGGSILVKLYTVVRHNLRLCESCSMYLIRKVVRMLCH